MAIPGLVPNISGLINRVIQSEVKTVLTADTVTNVTTAINGVKVPATGIVSGILNAAVGTAQALEGAVSQVIGGAAAAVGLSVGSISSISHSITGLSTMGSSKSSGGGTTAPFNYSIPSSSSPLRFPMDLSVDTGIRIGFSFMDYSKENAQSEPTYNKAISIYLPVPANLTESYGVTYSSISPGLVGEAAAGIIQDGGTAISATIKDPSVKGAIDAYQGFADSQAKRLRSAVQGNGIDIGQAALLAALQYNIGGVNSILPNIPIQGIVQNYLGKIMNPSTTVTLAGVDLRTHQFTWTFAPKSKAESMMLQQIFKTFKEAMLPTVSGPNKFFLQYPQIVQPKFTPNEGNLYSFKPCVITDVSINHAGGGSPSFFYDTNAGTILQFTISLKETKMFVKEDPANNPVTNTPAGENASVSQPQSILSQISTDDGNVLSIPSPSTTLFNNLTPTSLKSQAQSIFGGK